MRQSTKMAIACRAPIRPIRKLKLDMLPAEVKKKFQLHWRPIFTLMEAASNTDIRETDIDADYISASYAAGKEYLKTRVSYVFGNERLHPERWEISTWSKKVARSSILKNGTEQDKANLPPEQSHRNRPRQQRGRNKPHCREKVSTPSFKSYKWTCRASKRRRGTAPDDEANDEEGQLPDLRDSLTPAAIARGQQIEEQVATEVADIIQQEQSEARRVHRIGIARGEGTTVHVGPRFPLQDQRFE